MFEFNIDKKEWYKRTTKAIMGNMPVLNKDLTVPFDEATTVLAQKHKCFMVNLIDNVEDAEEKKCILYVVAYCFTEKQTVSFIINAYDKNGEIKVYFDPLSGYVNERYIFTGIEQYNAQKHEKLAIGVFIELFMVIEACHQRQNQYMYTKEYRTHELEKLPMEIDYKSIKLKNVELRITREIDNSLEEVRKYVRHIESWGCRGHLRHYKNGKTVWIKPYVKGKGRIKDTKYEVG